jgi:hypothetical protein
VAGALSSGSTAGDQGFPHRRRVFAR